MQPVPACAGAGIGRASRESSPRRADRVGRTRLRAPRVDTIPWLLWQLVATALGTALNTRYRSVLNQCLDGVLRKLRDWI